MKSHKCTVSSKDGRGSFYICAGYDVKLNGIFLSIEVENDEFCLGDKVIYSNTRDKYLAYTNGLCQSIAYYIDVAEGFGLKLSDVLIDDVLKDRETALRRRT